MQEEKPTKKIYLNHRRNMNQILKNPYNRFLFKKYITEIPAYIHKNFHKIFQNSITLQIKYKNFKKIFIFLQKKWITKNIIEKKLQKNTEIAIKGFFTEKTLQKNPTFLYIILDDSKSNQNLLIINPETPISVTSLKAANNCERRTFLNNKYLGEILINRSAATKGKICHNIFENIMLKKEIDVYSDDLSRIIDREIIKASEFFEGMENQEFFDVKNEFTKFAQMSVKFKNLYFLQKKSIFSENRKIKIVLKKVEKSEFPFNSFKFGFKGQMDLLLKADFFPEAEKDFCYEVFIPFELKTGKRKDIFYEGQVMLYNVCFFEDFDKDKYSLLFYSVDEELILVKNDINHLKSCLRQRNYISILLKGEKIPKVITNEYFCQNCPEIKNCIFENFSQKIEENPKVEDLEDLILEKNGILEKSKFLIEKKLYKKQSLLQIKKMMKEIKKEEDYMMSNDSVEKEYGKFPFVFSNLYSLNNFYEKVKNYEKINYFIMDFDVCLGNLIKNDEDILNQFCIKKKLIFKHSTIFDIRIEGSIKNRIIICQNHLKILKINLQVQKSIIKRIFNRISKEKDFATKYIQKWILQKKYTNQYKKMRSNYTTTLFLEQHKNLSEIMHFSENYKLKNNPLNFSEKQKIQNLLNQEKVNEDQQRAIFGSLETNDFFMIQGFPGSGKTHTITVLLKILLILKKKVLVTCYTHKSLNVILNKLEEKLTDNEKKMVLRLVKNREDKKSDLFDILNKNDFEKIGDYKSYIKRSIFASTVLSLRNFNFREQDFDFVIIDESSLLLEPLILQPIMYSKKFILVGDHHQLSPLLKSCKNLLKKSFFEKMCKNFPKKTQKLKLQYRMNKDIMKLANLLIYKNQIKPGSFIPSNLKFPNPTPEKKKWLQNILNSSNSVNLINTENLQNSKNMKKQRLSLENTFSQFSKNIDYSQNFLEENTVFEIYKSFLNNGIPEKKITIITTFNKQLNYLSNILKNSNLITIDKSQGVENDVVIVVLSCSKSKVDGDLRFELIQSPERVNVALTRAGKRLVVVGNFADLRGYDCTRELVRICEERKWVVTVGEELFGN